MVVVVVGRVDDLFPGVSLFFFTGAIFDPLSDRISLRSSLLWVGSDFTQTFPVFSRKFSLLSCRAKRERESFSKHHLPRDIVISLLRRLIFLVQVVVTGHEVKLKIIKKYRCSADRWAVERIDELR